MACIIYALSNLNLLVFWKTCIWLLKKTNLQTLFLKDFTKLNSKKINPIVIITIKPITTKIAMILLRKHPMKSLRMKLKTLTKLVSPLQTRKKEVWLHHRKATGEKNQEFNLKSKSKLISQSLQLNQLIFSRFFLKSSVRDKNKMKNLSLTLVGKLCMMPLEGL